MSSIKITSLADYSMATSLANANAILNEIMPEITKLNEALTGSVLNAVMGAYGTADAAAHHVDMLLRHQRIAVQLSGESEVHRRIELLLFSLPVSDRQKGLLKDSLLGAIQGFAERQDALICDELRRKFSNAVDMLDPAARVASVAGNVAAVQAELQQAARTWDAIQGTTSCGRIAFARARDGVIASFTAGVAKLEEIFSALDMYNNALSKLNAEGHHMLFLANDDASTLSRDVVKSLEQRRNFIQQYIVNTEKMLVPTQGPQEKHRFAPLRVPRDLVESLQGHELQIAMDAHMEANPQKYAVIKHYVARIGGDIDPVKGLFWRCPDGADGYASVPECYRKRYADEARLLWIELLNQPTITASVVNSITTLFSIGLEGDQVGKCALWDGPSAYWALMSKYRPLDAAYRHDVESYLDSAAAGFVRFNGRILGHVSEVQKRIAEARVMGLRIKWHKTGAVWVQHLSSRATFAVALQEFTRSPLDPDDCVMVLEQLLRVIEQTAVREFTSEDQNSPFSHDNTMLAQMAVQSYDGYSCADYEDTYYQDPYNACNSDALAAMCDAAGAGQEHDMLAIGWHDSWRPQNKGKGDSYVVPGRRLNLAQKGKGGKGRGRGGNYGKGGAWVPPRPYPTQHAYDVAMGVADRSGQWNPKQGCFANRCTSRAHSVNGKFFEFCLTCHKAALEKGSVTGQDGKVYKVLPVQGSSVEERRALIKQVQDAAKVFRARGETKTAMSAEEMTALEEYIEGYDDQEAFVAEVPQVAVKRPAGGPAGPPEQTAKRGRQDVVVAENKNAMLAALESQIHSINKMKDGTGGYKSGLFPPSPPMQ